MGVGQRQAKLVEASRDGDRIVEIVLDGSERVSADLFVDASGAEAMLLGAQAGSEFESWNSWLACDRLLAASAPALKQLPAYSQVTAFESGWVGLFPLQGRTAVLGAFRSDGGDDSATVRAALAAAGLPVAGDAVVTPFHAGAQRRPWIGNCVAIGDAAVALEPLDAVQLHLIHVGLSHLIALFPVDAREMPEAMSYNAAILSHAVNVRDFQIAHYKLNGRGGEPFWDRAREAGGPASLDAKLSLFASRGQVATYDDESFEPQNWAAIFIGHGMLPRSYDHLVDDLPREEQIERLQRLLRLIADEVNQMPSVNDYLAGGPAAPEPRPAGLF
jgi:tryptophan halogenase